jgi:hypothetical protein
MPAVTKTMSAPPKAASSSARDSLAAFCWDFFLVGFGGFEGGQLRFFGLFRRASGGERQETGATGATGRQARERDHQTSRKETTPTKQKTHESDLRVAPSAQPARQLAADLQAARRLQRRRRERLGVRVDDVKLHALQVGREHAVDGVGSAAADTDDLEVFFGGFLRGGGGVFLV